MGAVSLTGTATFIALGGILALVLVLPFVVKLVERNLEAFLFAMGLLAALVSGAMSLELVGKALRDPLLITGAVLASGFLFRALKHHLVLGVHRLTRAVPMAVIAFTLVTLLGLASSLITAIIASLLLVEILGDLDLDRKNQVRLAVVACFSIGLGAALTPVGEPLATIATSKLGADFWFLLRLIGPYVIPGILALGLFAAFFVRPTPPPGGQPPDGATSPKPFAALREIAESHPQESPKHVVIRAAKVFLFVMALVFLGEGFKPAIDRFVIGLPSGALYWLNSISAVLDNATLTAAEISAKMSPIQIRDVLLGLLISGGMLIPGNIPNIVTAEKIEIGSREWGRLGVPIGLAVMVVYFLVLLIA